MLDDTGGGIIYIFFLERVGIHNTMNETKQKKKYYQPNRLTTFLVDHF